ncbi:MAG: DUF423 domain-containing protein [Betaproteobacteria bacterium]|nr:DUF423 domain-containing protein [Betaproteobacteria bacterium]
MPAAAKLFLAIGAFAMLAAVGLGAFGAHALKTRIAPELLAVYHTGVDYHFYHALGLLAVGLVALRTPESTYLRVSGWLMTAGILIFSGSLYALALTGVRALGAVTPFGGVAFLLAWAMFAIAVLRASRTQLGHSRQADRAGSLDMPRAAPRRANPINGVKEDDH